jgi:hypothetical protein
MFALGFPPSIMVKLRNVWNTYECNQYWCTYLLGFFSSMWLLCFHYCRARSGVYCLPGSHRQNALPTYLGLPILLYVDTSWTLQHGKYEIVDQMSIIWLSHSCNGCVPFCHVHSLYIILFYTRYCHTLILYFVMSITKHDSAYCWTRYYNFWYNHTHYFA